MDMYFSEWNEYKLTLLFSWCIITEIWQFVLVWIVVFLAAVFHHWLKLQIINLETTMTGKKRHKAVHALFDDSDTDDPESYFVNSSMKDFKKLTQSQLLTLRVGHFALVASSYGLSLLLMLVAMTYNSWLFVALILGYALGDFMFFQVLGLLVGVHADDACH
jgi:hypothetical protein